MASFDIVSDLPRRNDVEANEIRGLNDDGKPPTVEISNEKERTSSPVPDQSGSPGPAVLESEVVVAKPESNVEVTVVKTSSASLNSTRFYPGDVVVFKEDKDLREWTPLYGTVLKPVAGSEMDNNPDKGSSTRFSVFWDYTNVISSSKADSVSLVDRVLLRGQRVENRNGDIGTVVDYEVNASVLINGTDNVIEKISLNRLTPICAFVRGQEILLNGWIGVVTGIRRTVWFRMDGGFVFWIDVNERDGFSRVDPYWGLGIACPGMRTRLPPDAFKRAQWTGPIRYVNSMLPLQYLYSRINCTILRTEVIGLEVKWLQTAPGAPENMQKLKPVVDLKELGSITIIGTPSTETIGINSVRNVKILPEDNIVKYHHWLDGFKKRHVDEIEPLPYPKVNQKGDWELSNLMANGGSELPVKVMMRHNVVTVQWADGSLEKIPAIKIPRISPTVDDGEFPMGLTVAPLEKNKDSGDKYGVVMASVELAKSRSRKVNVRWIAEGEDKGVEEVAVFDIRPHEQYSLYHRGTIVFPRNASTASFVSAVVIDLNVEGGKMVVKTSNNTQTEVYPHQVAALSRRCHWSFYTRTWVIDDMVPPPYQLDLEFSYNKKLVDVNEYKWDLLNQEQDANNPAEPTLWDEQNFDLLAFAPETHRYYKCSKGDTFGPGFAKRIEQEIALMKKDGLPEGIWVRCYENRMDLLSVLMVGPTNTPYEDGLFLFDIQLSADFPESWPSTHYVSYTHEIHPLLSFDGNVCTSKITWSPKDDETSNIASFLSKLQTLIFTPTPYFSHPPKKEEEGTDQGQLKACMYNQNVFIRVLDSLWNMAQNPHQPWEKTIRNHFSSAIAEKCVGIEKWISGESNEEEPSYPILPLPDGMKLAIQKRVENFKRVSNQVPSPTIKSVTDSTADSESFEMQQKDALDARMLTPIAEMTEPSSTSTFGAKHSNATVPSDDDAELRQSLDSLKNVKLHKPNKIEEVDESEKIDAENNPSPNPDPAIIE